MKNAKVKNLNLRYTVESGQPLTFHADCDWTAGTVAYNNGTQLVTISVSKHGGLRISAKKVAQAENEFTSRFRVRDDMEKIYSEINTDPFMDSAIRHYNGMRLTLNDPWETTICFILSQYNNLKRIRKIVLEVKRRYGERAPDGSIGFPKPERIMALSERELMECGMGFRAKYIKSAAQMCTDSIDLKVLGGKDYDTVKSSLMEINGVGEKVADCIALMGYGKMEAFPIDVWVKRTLEKVYFKGRDKKINRLMDFAEERWGANRGYAQQYIFWNGMNMVKR